MTKAHDLMVKPFSSVIQQKLFVQMPAYIYTKRETTKMRMCEIERERENGERITYYSIATTHVFMYTYKFIYACVAHICVLFVHVIVSLESHERQKPIWYYKQFMCSLFGLTKRKKE